MNRRKLFCSFILGTFAGLSCWWAYANGSSNSVEVRFVATDHFDSMGQRGVTQGYLIARIDGKWVTVLATNPGPINHTDP